jgi:hypothetical protein
MYLRRSRRRRLRISIALCRACAPHAPAHRTFSRLRRECRTPYREPLQFIVIAVTSVMSGTFPDTYGVFYVTINCWRVREPSRHRHQENPIGKRLSSYHDGDDARDGHLRTFSCGGSSHRERAGGTPAIRSIRRTVARASPRAVWSPPGSFWFL